MSDQPTQHTSEPTNQEGSPPRVKHATLLHAVHAVMRDVTHVEKTKSQGLSYAFASEESIVRSLRDAFLEHGLVIFPVDAEVAFAGEYQSSSGKAMVRMVVRAAYEICHIDSGQTKLLRMLGEGTDIGDKATAKAMTQAYKYVLRQTDMLITGDDPDKHPSEQYARNGNNQRSQQNGGNRAEQSAPTTPEQFNAARAALNQAGSINRLEQLWAAVMRRSFTSAQKEDLRGTYSARMESLKPAPQAGQTLVDLPF